MQVALIALLTAAGPATLVKTPMQDAQNSTASALTTQDPAKGEEVVVLETDKGTIVVKFFADKAPKHVESFKKLSKEGFYDGTRFHRCIPGFMIQGGDPTSKDLDKADMWGTGGPDFRLKAEFNDVKHTRGVLSMARSADPDSAGSQFFLMHKDAPFLDGKYTAFGIVVRGIEVVDKIVATGPTDQSANGKVPTENAVVLKKAEVKTWPLDKE